MSKTDFTVSLPVEPSRARPPPPEPVTNTHKAHRTFTEIAQLAAFPAPVADGRAALRVHSATVCPLSTRLAGSFGTSSNQLDALHCTTALRPPPTRLQIFSTWRYWSLGWRDSVGGSPGFPLGHHASYLARRKVPELFVATRRRIVHKIIDCRRIMRTRQMRTLVHSISLAWVESDKQRHSLGSGPKSMAGFAASSVVLHVSITIPCQQVARPLLISQLGLSCEGVSETPSPR